MYVAKIWSDHKVFIYGAEKIFIYDLCFNTRSVHTLKYSSTFYKIVTS